MKVLLTGSSGMIGQALGRRLEQRGDTVVRLVRREPADPATEVRWDPAAGSLDASALEGLDAVVHLAGESIAAGRWNAAKKQRILESRVTGTLLLSATLAGLERKPSVLVSASAIGYYGDRGDEVLGEDSAAGEGFLADTCRQWEAATEPAAAAGIRAVQLRIGVVLAVEGGALAKMLPPFKLGLGGRMGSGRQYWSWVALEDLVGMIVFALEQGGLRGAVNAVSPAASTNTEFTRALGKALGRPALFPMPAFAARALLGEMADALLLASTRVSPAKLEAAGFAFRSPELEAALREILGRA